MSFIGKLLYHQMISALGRRSFRFPIGIYLYLTFRCNLRCAYCDGGSGAKFPEMRRRELTSGEWAVILRSMARHSNVLMLSGGEPTIYPELEAIIREARVAGFSFISLNTNGLLLTPAIVDSVDALIISLDSLDREKSDRLWNRSGATDRVIDLLERLAGRTHPSVMVNSVIMPENIDDLPDVLEFCRAKGIAFSAGPALDRTRPVPGLAGNPRYRKLLERILQAKRDGAKIAATVDYLKAVRHFRPFQCHPLLVWRVYPDGELVYPCSRLNRTIGSLVHGEDPISLLKQAAGGEWFDPRCGENCPLSCYMDASYAVSQPLVSLREGLYRFRSFSRGHRLIF